LADDRFKDMVISSLSFLNKASRETIYAFVIMKNHIHLIWQIPGSHSRKNVQRDFLKFTSQQILKIQEIKIRSFKENYWSMQKTVDIRFGKGFARNFSLVRI